MDAKQKTERVEDTFSSELDSLTICDFDSFRRKNQGVSLRGESVPAEREGGLEASRKLSLPAPGERLRGLMRNRTSVSVPQAESRPERDTASTPGTLQNCDRLLNQIHRLRHEETPDIPEVLDSLRLQTESLIQTDSCFEKTKKKTSAEENIDWDAVSVPKPSPKPEVRVNPFEAAAEPEFEREPEPEADLVPEINAGLEVPEPRRRRRTLRFVLEGTFGILLGLVILAVCLDLNRPVERRVVETLQTANETTVTYTTVAQNLLKTDVIFQDLELASGEKSPTRNDLYVSQMNVRLAPASFLRQHICPEVVEMEGVAFSPWSTAWKYAQDSSCLTPLFSEKVENQISEQMKNLDSLGFLEGVKTEFLPKYEELSIKIQGIQTESDQLLADLRGLLNVEDVTPEILREKGGQSTEIVSKVERLADLRESAQEIQIQWVELNAEVAVKLQSMQSHIAVDGRAFSELLRYTRPTEEDTAQFLFTPEAGKRLADTLVWSDALERMVHTGLMTNCPVPASQLNTSGEIELFGQPFRFSGTWYTRQMPGTDYAFDGNIQLMSDDMDPDMLINSFAAIEYEQKQNLVQKHLTARIPLKNVPSVWGDASRLAFCTQAQNAVVLLDLTFIGDEICGSITLEQNELTFMNEKASINSNENLLAQHLKADSMSNVVVEISVSGTCSEPEFECVSPWTKELQPGIVETVHDIHQAKREELIASIYERLKNAETAFNGVVEPFYQEMAACSENTQNFRDSVRQAQLAAQKETKKAPTMEAKTEEKLAGARTSKKASDEPMSLAHVDLDQVESEMDIPVFNPDLGKVTPQVQVGSNAEAVLKSAAPPALPGTAKSVPVKKVAEISLPNPVPVPMAAPAPVPAPAPVSAPISVPTVPEVVSETLPEPNVSAPVMYSSEGKKSARASEPAPEPIDIPISKPRKSQQPMPMMRATTNYGS